MTDPSVALRQGRNQESSPDEPFADGAIAIASLSAEEDAEESMEEVLAGIAEGYKEVLAGDHKPIEELFANLA